ncbi:hypothetical protein LSH36_15g20017 [Paralvinella palmiformis]|uniref:G-protein coupled receptors family 1 profile domain-containing protein n=1 Tax=Paralvinella palmiformis TaxID=53620 RepID=A0AAD9KCP1_9ANNE|nr:hypothetical protein LSH36_15g20017 [Paralvinella palmiformis]
MESINSTAAWLPLVAYITSLYPDPDADVGDDQSTTEPPYDVPRRVYFVMSGVVIMTGLVFNTLSFIVLLSSLTLRQTASGLYLISLSLADTIFLFGDFLRWLNSGQKPFNIDIHFMDVSQFACKLIYFLRYGGKLTSSWLTVAITTERLLLVACPLKHPRISTPHKTRMTIAAMFVVCFLFASFPFWSVDLAVRHREIICVIDDVFWYELGSWFALRIGSLLLPGAIVCVMTGVIIYFMTHAQQRRMRKLSSRLAVQRQNTTERTKMALEKQLTMMLVMVAIAFLVLRLPYTVTYYMNEYKEEIWPTASKWFYYRIYAANKMADTLATLNYAINFFLYYFCGKIFRKQLKLVCTCAVCGARGLARQRSASSVPMTAVTNYFRSRSVSSK